MSFAFASSPLVSSSCVAQFADRDLELLVLLLAGRELLAQLLDLPLYVRDLLFFLRFILGDLAHGLLRLSQFLLQIRILRDQRLHTLPGSFCILHFGDELIALLGHAGDLASRLIQLRGRGILLLLSRAPAFLGGAHRLFQLRDLGA